MNELQLSQVEDIRNAINDLYDKLKVDLYKKHTGVKVRYEKVDLPKLVEANLEFIVSRLNQLRDGE